MVEGTNDRWYSRTVAVLKDPAERHGLIMVAAGALSLAVSAVAALAMHSPLGHDESVYALRGRYFEDSASVNTGYWNAYRAPGFPYILSWFFRLHESAGVARLLVASLSLGTLGLIWLLGRRLVNPTVGGVAALLAGVSPWFVSMSTFLFIDGPGTMFSLACVVALLPLTNGHLPVWRSLLGVAAAWIATAVRFGAPLCYGTALAPIAIVVAVDAVRARAWSRLAEAGTTIAACAMSIPVLYFSPLFKVAGFTPAQANSQLLTSKGLDASTGWRDLVNWFDNDVLSSPGATLIMFVLAAGLVASVTLAIVRNENRRSTFMLVAWFGSAVAGLVVSVGLIVTNYLMIAVPPLTLAAATGLVGLVELLSLHVSTRFRHALTAGGLAMVAVVGCWASLGRTKDLHEVSTARFSDLRRASVLVREELGPGCFTLTSYSPQVGWYSGCAGGGFPAAPGGGTPSVVESVLDRVDGVMQSGARVDLDAVTMIVVEDGKRQPTEAQLSEAQPFLLRTIFAGRLGSKELTAVQVDPCIFDRSCESSSTSP